jgi:hypothetical protein
MVEKRIVCSDRVRRVPKQFSWIDQALVRKKYICDVSYESLSLYLFLVTVADSEGVSYYSDYAIKQYLRFNAERLDEVRQELCCYGLIAYSRPFYQVLSLNNYSSPLPPALCENREQQPPSRQNSGLESIGQILKHALEGCHDKL